jgi:hypothetical protein
MRQAQGGGDGEENFALHIPSTKSSTMPTTETIVGELIDDVQSVIPIIFRRWVLK